VSFWLCVLGDDASNMSNYIRSSSPEYDEVMLTDNSEDEEQEEEEFSEEIPVKAEQPKSSGQDVPDRDYCPVIFDDSESDEFSMPQVDWSSIHSLSPSQNPDTVLPLVDDKTSSDSGGIQMSTEPAITNQCEITNSLITFNEKNIDNSKVCQEYVSEDDTNISGGLIFNVSSASHLGAETTLLCEETKSESPVHSMSRLSRKRSRTSKDEDQVQCKRLHHDNADDIRPTLRSAAEAVLPRSLQGDTGSAHLQSSYDNVLCESNSESDSLSQPASFTTETAVIGSGSNVTNIFSQDSDASFSQGTL